MHGHGGGCKLHARMSNFLFGVIHGLGLSNSRNLCDPLEKVSHALPPPLNPNPEGQRYVNWRGSAPIVYPAACNLSHTTYIGRMALFRGLALKLIVSLCCEGKIACRRG